VLLDPTYGGTSASFGMMGDVIIAEKNARIGFGGRKLVENILHEKIEDDFQTAESALENGGVDVVCDREEIIDTVLHYLRLMKPATSANMNGQPEYDYERKDPATVWSSHRNNKRTFNISKSLFDDLVYLRGDRIGGNDESLQCGIGSINGTHAVFIAQDKGQDLGDTIRKNFGMTSPEGYRKAMRVARLAEKLKLPILILIDSPGAHPGSNAEKGNQSIAISECMMSLLKVKTPVITIVAGEGCSGGALALSISDRIAMFSGSMYAVISPESYSSIIYNEYTPNSKILSSMKYLATDLYDNKLIDDVLRQGNIKYNNRQIRNYFLSALVDISSINMKELLKARYDRIRNWDKR
jgi:acetyl-CoA carboxylase carboxyl transferase subunit beta